MYRKFNFGVTWKIRAGVHNSRASGHPGN